MEITSCSCGCSKIELVHVDDTDIDQNGSVTIPSYVNRMDYGFTPFNNLDRLVNVTFNTPTVYNHQSLKISCRQIIKNCPNLRTITLNETPYNVANLLTLNKSSDGYYTNYVTYLLPEPIKNISRGVRGFTGRLFYASMQQSELNPNFEESFSEPVHVAISKDISIQSIKSLQTSIDTLARAESVFKDKNLISLNTRIKKYSSTKTPTEQIRGKIRDMIKEKAELFSKLCHEYQVIQL